jgi:Na+-transporting NADH:ubiquinone oxidoreductase subunit NqrB
VLATRTAVFDPLAVPVSESRSLRTLRLAVASLVALVSMLFLASAASAQTESCTTPEPYGGTVCVREVTTVPETTTKPTVLAETQTRDLAFTGGDMVGLAAIGGGAVAIGTALVLAARRRRSLELA